jgi:hypothetical protein
VAQYRALADIYPGGNFPYITAGTVFSDTPSDTVPQMVLQGWTPCAMVDPLNTAAVQAFWNAGVQLLGRIAMGVQAPATYWVPFPAGGGTRPYILTGLGAALGFQNWLDTRGAWP